MPETCIIIPCYNEQNRLEKSEFISFLADQNEFFFLFVNDGSQDETLRLLKAMKAELPNKVNYLDLEQNKGKAEAVRLGILSVINDFERIGYLDADLATPLSELLDMSSHMDNEITIMVMGSRIQRLGAQIKRSFIRHVLGRIFATVVSKMLQLPVYDTQCGAKIFRKDKAEQVFKNSFLSKWLFDVEILFRLKRSGLNDQSIVEHPLQSWYEKGDSRIKISDILQFPIELIKIYNRYR